VWTWPGGGDGPVKPEEKAPHGTRSLSTVSREIRRNGGCSAYRASEADTCAWERALRPKPCRLARHAEPRWRVVQKLTLQCLFIQTSGVLKKELMAHLRTARQMRHYQAKVCVQLPAKGRRT
jgi:IS30 family transposase